MRSLYATFQMRSRVTYERERGREGGRGREREGYISKFSIWLENNQRVLKTSSFSGFIHYWWIMKTWRKKYVFLNALWMVCYQHPTPMLTKYVIINILSVYKMWVYPCVLWTPHPPTAYHYARWRWRFPLNVASSYCRNIAQVAE